MSRLLTALLVTLSALGPRVAGAIKEVPRRVIEYRDDKLTLRGENIPVEDVLGEITRQSGAEIHGRAPAIDNVSADFERVPLNEALQRLLGENFTLRYGDDKRLKTIELKGGPEEARRPAPTPSEFKNADEATDVPAAWMRAYRAFDGRAPVPVSGKFAQLISGDNAGWDMVVNTAYAFPDRKVRDQAVRDGLRAFENNPELRAAVMETIGTMDETDLANFTLHNCKWMCDQLVKNIARQATDRYIRTRALALLRQLRSMPRPEVPTDPDQMH